MQPPLVQTSLGSGPEVSCSSYRMGYNDAKDCLTFQPKPAYTGCCNGYLITGLMRAGKTDHSANLLFICITPICFHASRTGRFHLRDYMWWQFQAKGLQDDLL